MNLKTFIKRQWAYRRLSETKKAGLRYANFFSKVIYYLLQSRDLKREDHAIYVDVRDNRFDRHLYLFLLFLTNNGYKIYLRFRPRFLSQLRHYSQRILALRKLKIVFTSHRAEIYISDKREVGSIYLSDDFFETKDIQSSFVIPHTFHPNAYSMNLHFLERLRNKNSRTIDCFFAGNYDTTHYDNGDLRKYFRLNTRVEIINYLLKNVSQIETDIHKDKAGKIVIHNSQEINLDFQTLFEMLSDSKFFLAVPGVVMPQCHNVVEAMAVGTIPITQFPHYFNPPLENGKNCLVFDHLPDLLEILSCIPRMTEKEISDMRNCVVEYFNTHLSEHGVVSNFANSLNSLKTLYLNAEYRSVELLKKQLDEVS